MKRFIPYLILAALVGGGLFAQNQFGPQPGHPPTPSQTSQTATDTPTATSTAGTSSFEPCGYMWAYHNSDELSALILSRITAIEPAATGYVSFYGEDCVYADGHSTFGVMETDFYIHKPVDDLTNEEAFGNWMVQVLQLVIRIPREKIQGNYGFVEFWFEKSGSDHVIVRVPVQQYLDGAQEITGAALFRLFHVGP